MVISFDQYWLTMLIAVILPALVSLVTKQLASSGLKAVILLLLSAVTGALTSIQNQGGTFVLKDVFLATLFTFLVAVGVHFGLLKPAGITGSEGAIQTAVPGGIGKPVITEGPGE